MLLIKHSVYLHENLHTATQFSKAARRQAPREGGSIAHKHKVALMSRIRAESRERTTPHSSQRVCLLPRTVPSRHIGVQFYSSGLIEGVKSHSLQTHEKVPYQEIHCAVSTRPVCPNHWRLVMPGGRRNRRCPDDEAARGRHGWKETALTVSAVAQGRGTGREGREGRG